MLRSTYKNTVLRRTKNENAVVLFVEKQNTKPICEHKKTRACSSNGRAAPLQGDCWEFESPQVHQLTLIGQCPRRFWGTSLYLVTQGSTPWLTTKQQIMSFTEQARTKPLALRIKELTNAHDVWVGVSGVWGQGTYSVKLLEDSKSKYQYFKLTEQMDKINSGLAEASSLAITDLPQELRPKSAG